MLQCQVFRQAFAKFRIFQICHRILCHLLGAHRQIFVEGFDGRKFPCSGGRRNAVIRRRGVRIRCTVISEIRQEIKDFRRGNLPNKFNVYIFNRNIIQPGIDGHVATHQLDEPKEHAKVEIVLGNGLLRLAFDGLVVCQKIPQNLRTIGVALHKTVLHLLCCHYYIIFELGTQQNFYFVAFVLCRTIMSNYKTAFILQLPTLLNFFNF